MSDELHLADFNSAIIKAAFRRARRRFDENKIRRDDEGKFTFTPDPAKRGAGSASGRPRPSDTHVGPNRQRADEIRAQVSRGELSPEDSYRIAEQEQIDPDEGLVPDPDGTGRWVPLPDEMYHVTTAREAVRESGGLRTPRELGSDVTGLGGSNGTISLTTSPEAARRIQGQLLEAHAVVTGAVGIDELLELAEQGDDSGPFLDNMRERAPGWWHRPMRLGKETPSKIDRLLDPELGQADPLGGSKPWTDQELVDARLEFYNAWAIQRQKMGGPPAAFFMHTDAVALANLDPREISILKVKPKPNSFGRVWSDEHNDELAVHTGEILDVEDYDFDREGLDTLIGGKNTEPLVASNHIEVDEDFYERAKEGVRLANEALSKAGMKGPRSKVARIGDDDEASGRALHDGRIAVGDSTVESTVEVLLHEYGHSVDRAEIGGPGFNGMPDSLYQAMIRSPLMDQVRWRKHPLMPDARMSAYMTSGREMFARAYSQMVREKAGIPIRPFEYESAQAWPEDEFAPIRAEMEKLLIEKDLMDPPDRTILSEDQPDGIYLSAILNKVRARGGFTTGGIRRARLKPWDEEKYRRDREGQFTFKPGMGRAASGILAEHGVLPDRIKHVNPVKSQLRDERLEEEEVNRFQTEHPDTPRRAVPTPGGTALVPMRRPFKRAATTEPLTRDYREGGVDAQEFQRLAPIGSLVHSGEFVSTADEFADGLDDMSSEIQPMAQSTFDAIQRVHRVPTRIGDYDVPKMRWIAKREDGLPSGTSEGQYSGFLHDFKGRVISREIGKPTIWVDQTQSTRDQEWVAAHEMGHYMDQVINFKMADRPFYNWATDRSITRNTTVARLFESIDNSPLIERMYRARLGGAGDGVVVEFPDGDSWSVDPKWRTYMLSSEEKFAIAYNQWIAIRSGDKHLLHGLRKRQNAPDNPWRRVWSDEEFEPIAERMDELFDELGWKK